MERKYRISKTVCLKCGGLISWDDYPNPKWPIHVDNTGRKIGDGGCPRFRSQPIRSESSSSSLKPISKQTTKARKPINPYIKIASIVALLSVIPIGIGLSTVFNQGYQDYTNNGNGNGNGNGYTYYWEIDAQGTVTYIVDGDTYDVNTIGRIRLADIDCPDQGEPGCQEAKDYLNSLINGEQVYLDIDDIYVTDPYDRTVAVTYVRYNSTHLLNVNKDLLVQGFATIWNFDNEFNPYIWPLYVYYI